MRVRGAFGALGSSRSRGRASRVSSGVVTPPAVAVALDPPVTTAVAAKTLVVCGFSRMLEGQTGNTVRLIELTGNTTKDFGFDPTTGVFDLAGVLAWQSSADLDVVQFYNAIGGAAVPVVGNKAFRRSGVIGRFGTDTDPATGQLTRRSDIGGVGVNLAGAGHIVLQLSGVDLNTDNVEMHLLYSNNNRKIATNDTTDTVGGATNTGEVICAYGFTNVNRVYWQMAGAAAAGTSRVQTSSTDLVNANFVPFNNGTGRWKKFGQVVTSHVLSKTAMQSYGFGRRIQNTATSANIQTAITAGGLNNGYVIIGSNFASATAGAVATTLRGDFLLGGFIVTKGLTDAERYQLQAKLALVGQDHRAKAAADILAYYDEWFFAKDVDASGNVAGRNGLATLAFNKGAGSTDWDFAYSIPNVGVLGIRSPTANANNKFLANNNYFAGVITGSILSLHYNEQTNNSLQYTIAREDGSYAGALASRGNLAIGYDHNCSGIISQFGIAKAASETLFTGRFKVFAGLASGFKAWGAAIYEAMGGGANQAMGKYNTNTAHNSFTYNEVITDPDVGSVTMDAATWHNQNPSYQLDAPVYQPTPENLTATFRNDCLMLHQATFEAPTAYNPADGYSVNKPKRLQAKNKSYVTAGPTPLTHIDGGFAKNDYAGVADGNSTDKLQSQMFQQGFHGTRVAFAFKANGALTQSQMEEVAMNMYKLVA